MPTASYISELAIAEFAARGLPIPELAFDLSSIACPLFTYYPAA